jgi:hypothetical protein
MLTEEMRLDGNAAGGTLRELFARDVTAATATCAHCGAKGLLGGLPAYALAMGVVLRCPICDSVILRLARTPGALWLDASGLRLLVVPDGVPPA